MTLNELCGIGKRTGVMQIVPTKDVVRPAVLDAEEEGTELASLPLAAPTGPGGAPGFSNRAGSQIANPQVTNVYLGPFWADMTVVEAFSKAVVENGYLDPLRELGYGTGSGQYLGMVQGTPLASGSTFSDQDAQTTLTAMLDASQITGNADSLFMLILPSGVTSQLDAADASCAQYCGYHEAFSYQGTDIAYAVLPATDCAACGGEFKDFTAVYAHELAEAITDKIPGQGWVADDGEENGDLEAWTLLNWGPPTNPNLYVIQGYYTNERGDTIGAWRDTTLA